MRQFRNRSKGHPLADLSGLPPALAGELAFRRFCTPKISSRRTADHDALSSRARFHLRNARWVSVPTMHGAIQAYVYEPDDMSAATPSVLIALMPAHH